MTKVLKNLEIEPIRKTRGIQISYTSKYPRKAALIVNTIAEQYIVEQLDAKFEATRKATKWLSERISVLKKKVEESEKAVEMYKKESGLGSASGLPSQQVAEFSRQLMEVRSQRREAEASLGQMNLMADSPEGVGSMGKVLSSPLIQGLRVREVDLLRKISEFKTEYGERHPKMINLRTEIKDLRKKIKKEIDKIAFGIKNEVQVIIESEKSLEKDLDALKLEASEISRAEIRLRALEREAEADRVLFETFLKRFKETSTQDSIQQPDARVISRADIPSKPSFPNKKKTIGIAFAVSIFCGLFLISVLEFMDSGFRSTEQIETLTGISALGYIPQVDRKSPEDFILQKPYSAYGESIRSLRTSLLLSNVDTPPKVILVTSGIPEEGKTTTALSLARLAAMSGQKTFALECDLRRPTFAKRLMEKDLMAKISKKGLVELLAQEVPFSDVVHSDKSGIDFICAGRSVASPTDLFSSKQMTELVSKLSREYDLIVFDTPPVLAVSDARILGALADKTIFVTR
ncbi:MAG: GumC family protein, partial [Nitrospinota bacterium]